jgi:hypothetical protein
MFRDQDGSFVGRCGLHRWKFEELDEVELGYVVRSDRWGHGYATEMGVAMTRYAAEALALAELVGFTMQDNARSQRVLEKLGFTFERAFVDDDGEDLVLYRRSLAGVASRPTGSFDPDVSTSGALPPEAGRARLERPRAPTARQKPPASDAGSDAQRG